MAKKEESQAKMWLRVGLFLVISSGLIWYLSGLVDSSPRKSEVKGEKKEIVPAVAKERFNVLGERASGLIPDRWKKTVSQTVEENILSQTSQIIDKSGVAKEIKDKIEETTAEITGFPQKQKKEIEKQVIKQVCQELLDKVEKE